MPRLSSLLSMRVPALRTRRSTDWPNEEALGAGAAEVVGTGDAEEIGGAWDVVAEVMAKAEGADEMVVADENGDAEMIGAEADAEMVGAAEDGDAEMVGAAEDGYAEMVGATEDGSAEVVGATATTGAGGAYWCTMAAALVRAASTVVGGAGWFGGEAEARVMRTRRGGRW